MWVLPPFLTIWSHGSIPSFPAEEGGAFCWSWSPPPPPPLCSRGLATWLVLSRDVPCHGVTAGPRFPPLPAVVLCSRPEVSSKSRSWVLFPGNVLPSSLTMNSPFHALRPGVNASSPWKPSGASVPLFL